MKVGAYLLCKCGRLESNFKPDDTLKVCPHCGGVGARKVDKPSVAKGDKVRPLAGTNSYRLVQEVKELARTNGYTMPIEAVVADVSGPTVTIRLPNGLLTGGTRTWQLPLNEWEKE